MSAVTQYQTHTAAAAPATDIGGPSIAGGHRTVAIARIRLDGGTQLRAEVEQGVVGKYADGLRDGAVFPPIIAFDDGKDKWLADGFLRVEAHKQVGRREIAVDLRPGTRRDAILFAASANAEHGLGRTNADKRKAVQTLLADAEWGKLGDREIARRCAVSHTFVANLAPKRAATGSSPTPICSFRRRGPRRGGLCQADYRPQGPG